MQTARAVLFALTAMIVAAAANAQQQSAGITAAGGPPGLGGEIGTVGPQQAPSQPRPLFHILGVPIGIWAPVPPPYNVAANRNLASRPID